MKIELRYIFLLLTAFIASLPLSGQKAAKKVTISGIVVDGKRNPVPNVFITIDGKVSNSVTDQQGYYKIKVSPDAEKIGFSTIWSEGDEELISGRTTINHTLNMPVVKKEIPENNSSGSEISEQSSSVSNSKDLNKNYSSFKTIYELIQNEFPTILVQGKSIRIPGSVSLKLSTEPLFLVDGIEVTSIDNIIPGTISSIQVLKGSSASIYGMKGANGVILINLTGSKDNNKVKK